MNETTQPAVAGPVEPTVRRQPLTWRFCKDRLPEPEDEVLVWVDGHRGPAWRNNYALVAYLDLRGDWREERHPAREPLAGVIAWAHIDEPDA